MTLRNALNMLLDFDFSVLLWILGMVAVVWIVVMIQAYFEAREGR